MTIYQDLPARWLKRDPKLVSVGRLDKDTSGLILLTDRHDLVHRWTHPKTHLAKIYQVEIDQGEITAELQEIFASGELLLKGESKPCLPAELLILSPIKAQLTIVEGKYHQVRRMFASQGLRVCKLHRISFGQLHLGDLAVGQFRNVRVEEIEPKI
jgi:16S rRNA pseudouridine516 synthase